jgi:hypothetical protein
VVNLLGREITGVVEKEKEQEQEWIEKYRDAITRAVPGKDSRLKRAIRATARFFAVRFSRTPAHRSAVSGNKAKRNVGAIPPSETQNEKKAG